MMRKAIVVMLAALVVLAGFPFDASAVERNCSVTTYTFDTQGQMFPTMLSLSGVWYWTWGIDESFVPGEIVAATLTIKNIYEGTGDDDDRLFLHLLEEGPSGVYGYWDPALDEVVDFFDGQGVLLAEWSDPDDGTTPFDLVITFDAAMLAALTEYSADGNFALGFDPDCAYFNDGMEFTVVTEECVPCTGSIGDFVWDDLNGDGIQDQGEPGITGVVLNLYDAGLALIDTTVTDGAGAYLFTDLCAGRYNVEVDESTLPVGYVPTLTNVGDPATDSDVNPVAVSLPADDSQDLTIDFGYVLVEECGPCEGKVSELTLQYLGDVVDANIVVTGKKKKKDPEAPLIFDGIVQPGETFAFIGFDDKGTLGTEITITVNGGSEVQIHTSCSQPIGPGMIFGDFLVVAGASSEGGALCPDENEPEPDCGPCKGKVTELTLQYLGDVVDAHIVVEGKKKKDDPAAPVVFDGIVQPGETFAFSGFDKNGTLGTEITITINGGSEIKIHTSCSQPIGVGLIFGDFEVVAGASKDGGALCPDKPGPDPDPDPDCGPCQGKVTELTLLYLGDVDDANIVVEGKKKKKDPAAPLVFDGIVQPGETFAFSGFDKNGTLGTEITVTVNGGPALKIHTSCSQPIGIGMVFGDFLVVDGASKYGGDLCLLMLGTSGVFTATDIQIITNCVLGITNDGYDCNVCGGDDVDSVDVQCIMNAVLGL